MVTGAPSLRTGLVGGGKLSSCQNTSPHRSSSRSPVTVCAVFQVNPRDRPSATTVLQHPLLEKHISRHVGPQVITGSIQVKGSAHVLLLVSTSGLLSSCHGGLQVT